ncbi:MAG: phosphate/phosphite/phosphonate ABC transporter substrate-binding protein [Limisphaerales bacterium]
METELRNGMGSAPAPGAVFRALAENTGGLAMSLATESERTPKMLAAEPRPATPGAGVLPNGAAQLALAVLLFLATFAARAAEPAPELRPAGLRLLYSESLFANVNRNDALAAIRSWADALGRRRGFRLAVETGSYGGVEEAAQRIREQTVDMITCTALDYLQLAATEQIEPIFIPGWKQISDDYVVLTRRDRNLATLADLRGKSVVFYQTGAGLGRRWVDAALGERGLGSADDFFGANQVATKPSLVILPVFFGQTEVAVAKRHGWETMQEMNPQLATRLQVLTNSPSLPDAVICLHKNFRENPFRDHLIRGTAELQNDPQGQQILLLFKVDRMVPFQPEYLDGVRGLAVQPRHPVPPTGQTTAGAAAAGGPRP